jgi:hypothetical protein
MNIIIVTRNRVPTYTGSAIVAPSGNIVKNINTDKATIELNHI